MLKSFGDDIKIIKDNDSLIFERNNGFLVLGVSDNHSGFGKYKSIALHSIKDYEIHNVTELKSVFAREKKVGTPLFFVFNSKINEKIVRIDPVTVISNVYKNGTGFNISTIVILKKPFGKELLLKLMMTVLQARTSKLYELGVYDKFNYKEKSIITACPDEDTGDVDQLEIEEMLYNCVCEATEASLKDFDLSKDVIEYLEAAGIGINDMVEAGVELLVGVDDSLELRNKIETQLKLSLEDINVISLVIAGIRLEEDYENHRVAGIDVDDDPAYLYTDEVLGMAIANQIAGTKAIFNFKRYDEAKPGIIGILGPIMDDVCAGLVAGSMSKIFEDK
jgi:alpha-ribazole phosphatase CobZ